MKALLLFTTLGLAAAVLADPYVQSTGRQVATAGSTAPLGGDSGRLLTGPASIDLPLKASSAAGSVAEGELFVSSDFGHLSGSATGSVLTSRGQGCYAWCDNIVGGAPNGVSADTINVTSSTLAIGTVVDVQVRYTFSGSATFSGGGGLGPNSAFTEAEFDYTTDVAGFKHFYTGAGTDDSGVSFTPTNDQETFKAKVGSTISFSSELWLLGKADGNTIEAGVVGAYTINADANAYITGVTPGVVLTSLSGHRYNPVPEPATVFALASGLGFLGFTRRRRT